MSFFSQFDAEIDITTVELLGAEVTPVTDPEIPKYTGLK
jgi:hypothetical protein